MRLFTFAISSIVDSNTGYGLSGTRRFLEIDAAAQRGRQIRSKSGHGLLAALKGVVSRWIDGYRTRAQERRELAQLLGMNDRLLRDIGLSRGDLIAVQLGTASLRELQDERRGHSDREQDIVSTAELGRAADISREAANEASYRDRKCA